MYFFMQSANIGIFFDYTKHEMLRNNILSTFCTLFMQERKFMFNFARSKHNY